MKNGSLEMIIGDMVRRLEAARPEGCRGKNDDPLREIEMLMPADPVLASLHKEYLEANKCHKNLMTTFGPYDAMTEVAADLLDSARSAIQTRLIELQDIREEEVRTALKRRILAKRAEEEAGMARLLMEKRKQNKDSDIFFFWFVMMIWLMGRTLRATRKTLSAANDFALVSVEQEGRRSYA